MVWFIEPLEIADEISRVSDVFRKKGSGKYRLVARSDEGGGIYGLCSCEHNSKEEAANCTEARAKIKQITGG